MVDSAAQATVLSTQVVERMSSTPAYGGNVQLKGIADQIVLGRKIQSCPLQIGESLYEWDLFEANIDDSLLLGFDFLQHFGCKIDCENLEFKIGNQKIKCEVGRSGFNGQSYQLIPVVASRRIVIPPNTSKMITGKISTPSVSCLLINPTISCPNALIPYSVGKVFHGEIPLCVRNPTDSYIVFKKNQQLGYAEEFDHILNMDSYGNMIASQCPLKGDKSGDVESKGLEDEVSSESAIQIRVNQKLTETPVNIQEEHPEDDISSELKHPSEITSGPCLGTCSFKSAV